MGKLAVAPHQRQRRRLAILSDGPVGLYAAIEYFSPLSHWPLRETTGTVLDDIGSLNNDSTSANTSTLNGITAPDGSPAPVFISTGNNGGSAPDQDGYTPSFASGLTVVCAVRPDLTGGFGGTIASKRADANSVAEWSVGYNGSGLANANTYLTGGSTARSIATNAAAYTDDTWALVIARFDGSTTGYPDLRINGATPAQTQGGSGTANGNSTGRLQIGRLYSGNTNFRGAMAHLAIFAGKLTDPQCAIIEAAADAEGWY